MTKIITVLSLLFLASGPVNAESLILSSDSSCESWQRESTGCLYSLNSVAADLASGRIIAAGDRGTILLRDEEGNWIDVSPADLESDLNSVAVGVNGVCMACGNHGVLLSSFDRGETWRKWEKFDCSGADLLSVNFDPSHPSDFVITGEDGFVFSSQAGGIVATGSSNSIIGSFVSLCSGFPAFAVSASGEVFSLSNSIIPQADSPHHINGGTVLVSGGSPFSLAGNNGLILTMEEEWKTASVPVASNLNSIAAVEFGSVLCAVGHGGVIVVSRDNGRSWESASSGTFRNLNCVTGNGRGVVWIVGDALLPGVLFP